MRPTGVCTPFLHKRRHKISTANLQSNPQKLSCFIAKVFHSRTSTRALKIHIPVFWVVSRASRAVWEFTYGGHLYSPGSLRSTLRSSSTL